ncbi:hypothetical protein COCC4DRAFT_33730 [Bipolaris maydis ATCC 48331]|uniref:3-beta hydroxysteroid dehydrogenase/isomerase domain-containing protein n=2 Tax=Cochliobolus heterostrophus TaxID=5016 RepID=M2THU1_COCH5|nr:uncharacterized protein COCC4DRAFT_33730 [Bipolaris maydis ATCC 48331]EMD86074.1 hypothetical protein COCHEDRAFT_1024256 [Bipolaris maydis C5]KAJ5028156.1 hypothetical protein J3E73DRAFT_298846 [Bipolaris maydis]ENI02077.1 hypothetical protein COCC4DRAFT_33730 [Bipolaris maydis ATCC 48331]KAJ5035659.1 hydroxysteroid dehydrogenase [Bipolaris maydis]KAJ5062931.1 hydroxysteroid dehydrogenase [Bipolaris maydis]
MSDIPIEGPVLIFGGCGFLGHNLVREFARAMPTPKIFVVDVNTERNRNPDATYLTANIIQRDEIAKIFDQVKPQVVLHTISPSPFEVNRSVLEKVNVVGTENIVECAKAIGTVRAFLYTSSSSVVHNQHDPMIEATEDWPVLFSPNQPEYYSHTKALAEKLVLAANRQNGMLTAVIRPAALYGPGDGQMTTNVTRQALTGRANIRFGNKSYLYDTCYVENCTYAQTLIVKALIEASTSEPLPADKKIEGEAFFVTNDEHIPFWNLSRLVSELLGSPVPDEQVRSIPIWFMKTFALLSSWLYWIFSLGRKQPQLTPWVIRLLTMERTLCIDKIKTRLGYRPKFNNRQGWEKAIEWAVPKIKAEKGGKTA